MHRSEIVFVWGQSCLPSDADGAAGAVGAASQAVTFDWMDVIREILRVRARVHLERVVVAPAKPGLDLLPELLVEPAVDERVVAGAADGQPVTDEERPAVVVEHGRVGVKVGEEVVQVQRQPAQREDDHDGDEQLYAPLLGVVLGQLLVRGDGAHVGSSPQSQDYPPVRPRDEGERAAVLHNDGDHRQVLLEDVAGFRILRPTPPHRRVD